VLAVLLTVLAASSMVAGWAVQRESPSAAPRVTGASVEDLSEHRIEPTASHPTAIRIRSIGVAARIKPMGIKADHTVEVPGNPDDVGWYSLGSVPGHPGSAVLLGHVDSVHGPAVFARLRSLTRAAVIDVVSSDGSTSHFEVTKSATYPNAAFPARRVYRVTGRPGITLVTCGGSYDRGRGGYQANVVVYARLVGVTPAAHP
jgi:hypothetical protein